MERERFFPSSCPSGPPTSSLLSSEAHCQLWPFPPCTFLAIFPLLTKLHDVLKAVLLCLGIMARNQLHEEHLSLPPPCVNVAFCGVQYSAHPFSSRYPNLMGFFPLAYPSFLCINILYLFPIFIQPHLLCLCSPVSLIMLLPTAAGTCVSIMGFCFNLASYLARPE